ncbi:MAG: arginase family protein [Thermodesulfobacteriota bacterium]
MGEKIIFFGCPLDGDERYESIQEKLAFIGTQNGLSDPYEGVMEILRKEIGPELFLEKGSIDIPTWLRPIPSLQDKEKMNTESFVSFIDGGGFEIYSQKVGDFVAQHIFPDIPCMIAVDHSLTGGVYKKLAELYAPEDISLIVLDSHTDAIPISILSKIIQYDIDTNPETVYDRNDPYLYHRQDSYNASSFLYNLLVGGVLRPENLFIIGVSDYPPRHAFRIKDPRVENYVQLFSELRKKGVTILTKADFLLSPSKLKNILKHIKNPYVYISIDLDIGAKNAAEGVRFLERQGLNEKQIYRVSEYLKNFLSTGIQLVGMDLTEINVRKAGNRHPSKSDPTYRIGANFIKALLF